MDPLDIDSFEILYHQILHGSNTTKYENDLNFVTTYYYKHIHSIVEPFLHMINNQAFSNWYAYLSEHHVKERRKTPRDIKKRRVIIRRLFSGLNSGFIKSLVSIN